MPNGNVKELENYLRKTMRAHSALFSSPDQRLERVRYRAEHPTEITALKCMDGRVHLPAVTGTPLGILSPIRNIGGIFDLGWPFFQSVLDGWINYAVSRARRCLIFCTYHFSRGDTQRGCAGHHHDTATAIASAKRLRDQIERVYGKEHLVVHPIVLGFETDLDALIIHGENAEVVDLASFSDNSLSSLETTLGRLFPKMQQQVKSDFLPLLVGNAKHIEEVRKRKREPLALQHLERVLAVGRGFDWLHEPNLALIVGPYAPNIDSPISQAAGIIADNMKTKRVPDDGFVLFSCAPFREHGIEEGLAQDKAKFLGQHAMDVIKKHHPDLVSLLHPMIGVVDMNTRLVTLIEEHP